MDKLLQVLAKCSCSKFFCFFEDVETAAGSRASDLGGERRRRAFGSIRSDVEVRVKTECQAEAAGRDLACDLCYPDPLHESRPDGLSRVGPRRVHWFFCMVFTWAPLPTNGQRSIRILRERIRCWPWTCWGLESLSGLMSLLSAADHVRALVEFIRAKSGGERASIVASGLGAGFATILAAQHPEMVQRLILVMPVGQVAFGRQRLPKRYGVFSRVPLFNRGFYRRYLSTRIQIRAWLKNFGFVDPEKITEETIEVLTNCAQQFGADRAIIQWMSGRFDLDLEKRLAELSQSVTLIWGENAADPPLESGYRLQPIAKQCSLVVLPNSGVLVALESPMPVVEALVKELDPTIHVYKTG